MFKRAEGNKNSHILLTRVEIGTTTFKTVWQLSDPMTKHLPWMSNDSRLRIFTLEKCVHTHTTRCTQVCEKQHCSWIRNLKEIQMSSTVERINCRIHYVIECHVIKMNKVKLYNGSHNFKQIYIIRYYIWNDFFLQLWDTIHIAHNLSI